MTMQSELDNTAGASSLSRYDVLGELGQGGMATVYLARTVGAAGFERLVVIKRLHSYLTTDDTSVQRFLNEARIAAHVHHANVVGIQDVGCDDDGYFLVYDYVEGDSLQGLMDRARKRGERVPPRVVARILLDALAGLHAAHETCDSTGRPLSVLHRDVTPQNVLIGRDGIGRLTDFGVAKATLSATTTETGSLVGKVLYLPPEYLRREQVDRRMDVYGMGVTAWVAMSGSRPWASTSEGGLVLKIVTEGVPSLAPYAADVPPAVVDVIMRACAKTPEGRFPSARAMAQALEQAAAEADEIAGHAEVASYIEDMLGRELSIRRSHTLSDITATMTPSLTPGGLPVEKRTSASRVALPRRSGTTDAEQSSSKRPGLGDRSCPPGMAVPLRPEEPARASGLDRVASIHSRRPREPRWSSALTAVLLILAAAVGWLAIEPAWRSSEPPTGSGVSSPKPLPPPPPAASASTAPPGEAPPAASSSAAPRPSTTSPRPAPTTLGKLISPPAPGRKGISEVVLANPYTGP